MTSGSDVNKVFSILCLQVQGQEVHQLTNCFISARSVRRRTPLQAPRSFSVQRRTASARTLLTSVQQSVNCRIHFLCLAQDPAVKRQRASAHSLLCLSAGHHCTRLFYWVWAQDPAIQRQGGHQLFFEAPTPRCVSK